jgi:hypothetical protein
VDEGTVTELTIAVHILSVIIVLSTVSLCVALGMVARALETWLPTVAIAIRRDRANGAEGH